MFVFDLCSFSYMAVNIIAILHPVMLSSTELRMNLFYFYCNFLKKTLNRCNYLDICGEAEFMERMEVKYHEKAMETGSLVISACAFLSVPVELGLMFNVRQWKDHAAPNRIESYLSLESDKRLVLNFGTYESTVMGVANAQKSQELMQSRSKKLRPVVRTSSGSFS